MIFKGGTIRVVSPVTEDGNRPKLDDGGQQIWKEDFFPASAKRSFEIQNARLPKHLKKIIEPVSDGDITPPVQPASQVVEQPVVIKKRGPKPKNHAQSN